MTRGLMVSVLLSSFLAASAAAQDCAPADREGTEREAPQRPAPKREDRDDRGWIFGGGFTRGKMSFPGAEDKAVAVGPARFVPVGFGGGYEERPLALIDASQIPPPETVHVATFPTSQDGSGLTFHAGYAFSSRTALLVDGEFTGSPSSGFANAIGALVLRYRPLPRVWIEAGPAGGDIAYGYEGAQSETGAITGRGFLAAAGVSVLERPRWALDVQARYGRIWFDGFEGRNVSFGLSIGRVRSGKRAKPGSPAAAPRAAAARG